MLGRGRKRQRRKEKRQERRMNRKDARLDRRMTRKNARRDARGERALNRQKSRMFAVGERADAREAAYKAGIDPRGWIGDSIEGVADAAASAASNIYGQPQPAPGGLKKKNQEGAEDKTDTGMLAAAAIAAFLLMK